jgi:hypothetical protein
VYPKVRRSSLGLFAIVVIGAIASEYDTVVENIADVAAAALTLNLTAMTLSFAIAKLSRLSDSQSTAIALELGIHNSALAIAIGASRCRGDDLRRRLQLVHALHRRRLRLGDEPPQRTAAGRRLTSPRFQVVITLISGHCRRG